LEDLKNWQGTKGWVCWGSGVFGDYSKRDNDTPNVDVRLVRKSPFSRFTSFGYGFQQKKGRRVVFGFTLMFLFV
jgi:hypothetical protein